MKITVDPQRRNLFNKPVMIKILKLGTVSFYRYNDLLTSSKDVFLKFSKYIVKKG